MADVRLSEADRSDFQARLALLDLNEEMVGERTLEVAEGQSLRLDMTAESPVQPTILRTSDITQLRRWIGTPERAAAKRTTIPAEAILQKVRRSEAAEIAEAAPRKVAKAFSRAEKASKAGVARGVSLAELSGVSAERLSASLREVQAGKDVRMSAAETDAVRAAARTMIHGDYASVAEYRPAVEAFFKEFHVAAWLFKKILVKRNSTLILGPGVHNLTAYELEIEEGGRVLSYGHLTVRVTQLRHSKFTIKWPLHVMTDFTALRPSTH